MIRLDISIGAATLGTATTWLLSGALILVAGSLGAQTSPIQGDDVLVNNETAGTQINPEIMILQGLPVVDGSAGRGSTVFFGRSTNVAWTDPSGLRVAARSFDGNLDGWGLQSSRGTSPLSTDNKSSLAAAEDLGGGLAAILAIEIAVNANDNDMALLYWPTGTEIGLDFTFGDSNDPDLVFCAARDLLGMVFQSTERPSGNPTNGAGLLQLYFLDPLGIPEPNGPLIEVNNVDTGSIFSLKAAFSLFPLRGVNHERIVVVWESFGSPGNDNSLSSIQARFFEPDGTPIGGQFQVNTYIDGFQSKPELTALEGGGFVVVWQSDGSFGNDDSLTSIQARVFGSDGQPMGPEFQVNNEIMGFQYDVTVAAQNDGGFVVAWTDNQVVEFNVAARQFKNGGIPAADQFQVNQTHQGEFPAVAASGNLFMVTWAGVGDIWINGNHILIADGFESGDFSAWSATSQ